MKKILELIHVINRNKVKVIEVIGNLPPRKTKVQEFYEKISDGTLNTDRDAAAFFYDSEPDDRNYKVLKKRLTERLYNTALFIDVQQSKYDDIGKAYYTCWKEYAIAKVLVGKGAIVNAFDLMEKILKKSIKFEFTDLILDITRQLRLHYATHHFNNKKYLHYNELYHFYKQQYDAESLAEEYYAASIIGFYGIKTAQVQQMYEQASCYVKELEPLTKAYDSYKLKLCYYLIRLSAAKSMNDYVNATIVCEQAISVFKSNRKYSSNAIGIFMRQLFLLYWQQREYQLGEKLLEAAVHYTREGDISWFTNHNYFFLLCMHAKEYERAAEILTKISKHPRYKALPQYHQERWKVYNAYIAYLEGMGKLKNPDKRKFRLQKFLNDVPVFSSDKRGRNIPILIIQVLFLLLHKRYNDAIDRLEAIDQYCYRHLKRDETFRSNCFIKMLLKVIQADFHRAGAIRKAEKLLAKLKEKPLEVAQQVYETEIIPYEDLWEMAIASLENQFWKAKT